jgi:hypothetical protein
VGKSRSWTFPRSGFFHRPLQPPFPPPFPPSLSTLNSHATCLKLVDTLRFCHDPFTRLFGLEMGSASRAALCCTPPTRPFHFNTANAVYQPVISGLPTFRVAHFYVSQSQEKSTGVRGALGRARIDRIRMSRYASVASRPLVPALKQNHTSICCLRLRRVRTED